ncbi:hypothetical protein JX266_012880 [Neoarthrinium moseri]|nr:hypothetical protein JX266_012880 [Neoarthrinium moseri]
MIRCTDPANRPESRGSQNAVPVGVPSGPAVGYRPDVTVSADERFDSDTWGRTPTNYSIIEEDSVIEDTGRSYHGYKQGKYYIPNDGVEQDRLDFQHRMFLEALDGQLSLAPLPDSPRQVLDICCGTGIWSIQFAEAHPDSTVLGTDLSFIQPSTGIPPNCSFIKEDAEDEWLYPHKFDYIHFRFVTTCFDDPKAVMRSAFENLNPGGWIEYQDIQTGFWSPDESVRGTSIEKWGRHLIAGAAAKGRNIDVARHYKTWMEELGFENVTQVSVPLPGNVWPRDRKWKRVGAYLSRDLLIGLDGISRKMLVAAGLSPSEIATLLTNVRKELVNTQIRWSFPAVVVYGQKPLVTRQLPPLNGLSVRQADSVEESALRKFDSGTRDYLR